MDDRQALLCVARRALEVALCSRPLLPQVAVEHGWDAKAFLAAACQKAGLPQAAWRDPDCDLFVFQANVFTA